jgi:hypothetical protein
MNWIKERSLTLVLMAFFLLFLAGQILAGHAEYNSIGLQHGRPPATLGAYLYTGHLWEALFENWESEFLQMAVFVVFTSILHQRGSPESRRIGVVEPADADPRRFQHRPDVPWPVTRGGWVLWVYERSLGLAFGALFLLSWAGHALGGWSALREGALERGQPPPPIADYLQSSAFWFESFQNWQSEFLAIAAMVWLSVYLRQRGSPESKPVHEPHHESG